MVGPLFPEILRQNGGIFPNDSDEVVERVYAAWYACKLVHRAWEEIPGQVTYEGDTDITTTTNQIVRSACFAYGIVDIEPVMNFMPLCREWAFKKGFAWNPKFQAWLDSGGTSYNEITRDPDAI
jgi:hypothetical protein